MRRVFQIIYISIRGLLAKRTLYFLLFLLVLIIAAVGSQIYDISAQVGDGQSLLAKKADVLAQTMWIWSNFTIYFAIIFASSSIYNEINSKNIVGVLAKPLSRGEYLVGRWFGVAAFFALFIFVGTAFVLAFMLLWGIPITFLFVSGIIYQVGVVFVYSALAFTLSLFIPPIVGGGITFLLFIFRSQFEMLMESSIAWIQGLGYFLFYGSPAIVKEDLIKYGILDNLLKPNYGLYWSTIAENFLYSSLLIFLAVLLFKRKDITLNS